MPSGRFLTLRAKPYNDDLIVDALSKEGEKFTFSAKNAIKSKKRFAGGVLEPLHFVEFFYTQSKSGFYYIQEAKVIHGFSELRKDYHKLEMAFYFIKLISRATYEGLSDNKALFDLLGNSLKALESTEKPELLKLQFELKYLFYLGLLEISDDTGEFVGKPMNLHHQIELTDDEYLYLNQMTKQRLKQSVELLQSEV